jgi:chromosome segregation ATPase
MIDEQLLQSAKNIRVTFKKLNLDLDKYRNEIKTILEFLQEKLKYLENYNNTVVKKIKNNDDISDVTKEVLGHIAQIEDAEKKIQRKITKINEEIEKLGKDEKILYQTIKERYPTLTDENIIKEISDYLIEN